MSYIERQEKCIEACKECVEVCVVFEKENKGKPHLSELVWLTILCSSKCKKVISDGGSDFQLLHECELACEDCINECDKYSMEHSLTHGGIHEENLFCMAIAESCRQCREICNAAASASAAL